jgi:hypothetical protein
VSPGYFDTMGIALRAGRPFTSSDGESAPRVAILNETAARFYFRGRSPIGEPIALGEHTYEIVGVAADTKHLSLRDEPPRYVYVPVAQPFERLSTLILAVRADRHGSGLTAVRRELRSLGSEIVVAGESTLEGQVDKSLVRERLMSMLSATFGALGIVLAGVGLFGMMSFRVLGRMREIAVRMALGASSSSVRAAVLRESIVIVTTGVAIGVPLSLVAARALSGLVFGANPANILVIALCSTAMMVVAVVAGYLPARRASRVDPMTVLRGE